MQKQGRDPKALRTRPALDPGDPHVAIVWTAFEELHSARGHGFAAPWPIQVSEIKAWLDLNEIEELDERLEIARNIRTLDRTFLGWFNEREKRRRKKQGGKS